MAWEKRVRRTSTLALATILLPAVFAGCAAPLGGTFEQSLVRQLQAQVSVIRELRAEFAALNAEFKANIGGDVAGIKSSVGGDAAGIKKTNTQTAAGNINDAWAIRLAVIGGPASMLVYMFIVRPMRRRRKCRRQKKPGETAGETAPEFTDPIAAQISFAAARAQPGADSS